MRMRPWAWTAARPSCWPRAATSASRTTARRSTIVSASCKPPAMCARRRICTALVSKPFSGRTSPVVCAPTPTTASSPRSTVSRRSPPRIIRPTRSGSRGFAKNSRASRWSRSSKRPFISGCPSPPRVTPFRKRGLTPACAVTVSTARLTSSSPSAAPSCSTAPTSRTECVCSIKPARLRSPRVQVAQRPRPSASFPVISAAAAPSPAFAMVSPSARAWGSARNPVSRRTIASAILIPPRCRSS